tara:strand:- start:119 stop:334 length:216 start_codon:yes stop_codon:yes gene_type:complete
MKKFTIEIKNASQAQLLTIAAELRLMSHAWTKFGPQIFINGEKLQAPVLRIPGSATSRKRQATSHKPDTIE